MFWKFILTLLPLVGAFAQSQEPLVTKKTCSDIKFLPAESAIARPRVELEGIVTCVPAGWKGVSVSDETGGVYCEAIDSDAESTFWPVSVGERVVVQGVISEGHLNSFVLVKRISSREPSQLPDPKPLSLDKVVREVHDADFVTVRGNMVRITNIAGEMEYGLTADGFECDVAHTDFRIDPKLPIHTEVEISGVVIPIEGSNSYKIVVPKKECFSVLRTQEQVYRDAPIDSIESTIEKGKNGQLVRFRAFAGIHRSHGGQVHIEHGNVVATTQAESIATLPKKVDAVDKSFVNQIITTQGALVDRNTINGTTFLAIENNYVRLSVNIDGYSEEDNPVPLVFGATYSVTGLVNNTTGSNPAQSLILGDKGDLQYLTASPLSPWHRLAFSVFMTVILAVGLCISMISYRHLNRVKNRLEAAQSELSLANESLESRIEERTKDLQSLNQALTIAERKAKEANEAKIAFLANMSHELRTPMTAILGFTEILRDDANLTALEQQAFLDTIHRNGDHLLSVIDKILDLAKIESGKLSMDGYTAVELLRGKGCKLPIVALTAHAISDDADKCIAAGCDLYLTKPIDRTVHLTSSSELLRSKGGNSRTGSPSSES